MKETAYISHMPPNFMTFKKDLPLRFFALLRTCRCLFLSPSVFHRFVSLHGNCIEKIVICFALRIFENLSLTSWASYVLCFLNAMDRKRKPNEWLLENGFELDNTGWMGFSTVNHLGLSSRKLCTKCTSFCCFSAVVICPVSLFLWKSFRYFFLMSIDSNNLCYISVCSRFCNVHCPPVKVKQAIPSPNKKPYKKQWQYWKQNEVQS